MTLEERFKASSKNTKPTAYSGMSKLQKDTSRLNIDAVPAKYNTAGKLFTAGDTSRLNLDVTPTKYKG